MRAPFCFFVTHQAVPLLEALRNMCLFADACLFIFRFPLSRLSSSFFLMLRYGQPGWYRESTGTIGYWAFDEKKNDWVLQIRPDEAHQAAVRVQCVVRRRRACRVVRERRELVQLRRMRDDEAGIRALLAEKSLSLAAMVCSCSSHNSRSNC